MILEFIDEMFFGCCFFIQNETCGIILIKKIYNGTNGIWIIFSCVFVANLCQSSPIGVGGHQGKHFQVMSNFTVEYDKSTGSYCYEVYSGKAAKSVF